jgi:hypothetical protein
MGVWRVSCEALGGEEHDNMTGGDIVHQSSIIDVGRAVRVVVVLVAS